MLDVFRQGFQGRKTTPDGGQATPHKFTRRNAWSKTFNVRASEGNPALLCCRNLASVLSSWNNPAFLAPAPRVAYAFLVYMLPPLPRRSGWAYYFARSPNRVSLPRKGRRVGLRIVLFEACSAFTRVTACTLAPSPIRDALSEGFSHFVTSIAAPVASGWSGCRVGLAPTGKRRLVTAHTPKRPLGAQTARWKGGTIPPLHE